jgi:hypothetical protein
MHACRSTDTSPYNAPEDWRHDAADGDKKQYLNSSAILEEASLDEVSTSNSSTPQKSADKAQTMRSWLERAKIAREAVMGSDGVSRGAILHSSTESDSSDDDILFEHPSMRRESADIPDPPPSARSIFLQNLKKLDSEDGRNHSSHNNHGGADLPNPPSSHPIYIGRVDSSSDRYSRATANLSRNLSDAKDALHHQSASSPGGSRLGEGGLPAYDTHRSSSYNIGGSSTYSEERSRRNSEAYAYVNTSTGRSSYREREGAYYGGTYSDAGIGIGLGGASPSSRTSSRTPEHPAGSEQARIAVYEYRCRCVSCACVLVRMSYITPEHPAGSEPARIAVY